MMGLVLSVYTKSSFKEFILPSVNNSDYNITIRRDYFHIQEDIVLNLEVLGDEWFLREGGGYFISGEDTYGKKILQDKAVYKLRSVYEEELSLIVKEVASVFHAYAKYELKKNAVVTVGKNPDNMICYDYLGMVSRAHAVMRVTAGGLEIENLSPNGVYVNSVRIDGKQTVAFGTYINIMGLHMVYLGELLAVDKENGVIVNENLLLPFGGHEEATMYLVRGKGSEEDRNLYHRAPRNYEKLNSGTIEIEGPPQKNRIKRQPLFMTVGPSLTMVLPMFLGAVLMLYSSRASGGKTSLYMYSGLVMSAASAAVGVAWTLLNMRYQKKTEREEEEYRFAEYGKYLVKKAGEVREIYEDSARRLAETYPGAAECLDYSREKGELWNRNPEHDDFLRHRVGLGDIPFQYQLEIPKKQFTLYRDELAEKPAYIRENYHTLFRVPVTVDLLEKNLVGIVGGDRGKAAEVARLLSIQISANNCYTDVKLGYLYNNASSADYGQFDFARWLPHVWSEDRRFRYIASSPEDAGEVLYELVKVCRNREGEGGNGGGEKIKKPWYVIFISDAAMLRGELFAKYALAKDRKYGLTVVILASNLEELPNGCEFIIENTDGFSGMYDIFEGQAERQKIEFDRYPESGLERFARSLTALHVPEAEDGGEIPASVTFFEMLGVGRIEEYPVAERWAKNRTYDNIRGILGKRAGGADCYLDVHEKYHGPHGLVAGTTGSGKSETLQTYILSLAVNYSPDDVVFFIIDYKGGGMANLFEGLPHMIGSVSNLSGNQVKRAMTSIKSENRRRQRVFTENGVNNINLYTKLYKNGEAHTPVPHLFIIIDEFAELKREEPDFMRELISVAQVGRSLGVHLILATQKPGGTVDDNIWSNSKFRLCLRVQDQQDSKDMLHKPDAAYISQAGRGYLQVGNDEVYELFQSGFSGAVYDENMIHASRDIAKLVTVSGRIDMTGNSVRLSQKLKAEEIWIGKLCVWLQDILTNQIEDIRKYSNWESRIFFMVQQLYRIMFEENIDYPVNEYNTSCLRDFIRIYLAVVKRDYNGSLAKMVIHVATAKQKRLPQQKERTQLDVTKEFLASVAAQNGYSNKIRLWLPILPEEIYLSEFEEYARTCYHTHGWQKYGKNWNLGIVIGRMDDPENQSQMPLSIDFAEQGHIAVVGTIVSGKSTMLQTMAFALLEKFSPRYINIYAIDFSSKMMTAFADAPHTGGVMCEGDEEKIGKFFYMLQSMAGERKALFKGGNYKQYIQKNGVVLPAVILFIDNYASFKEKTEEKYESQMIQISKEGVSLGIYLVVTGGGFGYADISNRVGENIETALCLALKDKYAYGDVLHSTQIQVLPENGIRGRGLAYHDSRILEYQTALAVYAENDYQRMELIEDECKRMRAGWNGCLARKIPEIPKKPTWRLFTKSVGYEKKLHMPDCIPIGYNLVNADIYGISLREIYCYLVMGTPRSGKSNFMRVFVQAALDKEAEVSILEPANGSLRRFQKITKVTYLSGEQDIFDYFKDILTPVFQARNRRKNAMLSEDYDENDIFEVMARETPYFIFISDLAWFVQMIYSSGLDMRGFMETLVSKGRYHNIYFVAELALNKLAGVRGYQMFESFAEYKTGIHFGGKVSENTVLSFEHLSYKDQGILDKPGIGTLSGMNNGGGIQKVVIPLATK